MEEENNIEEVKRGDYKTLEDGCTIRLVDDEMYQRCCECGCFHFWKFHHTPKGLEITVRKVEDAELREVQARWIESCRTVDETVQS